MERTISNLIEMFGSIELYDRLEENWYSPSQSYELWDPVKHIFYNYSGQQLRNPQEYDTSMEGYTPFGDE